MRAYIDSSVVLRVAIGATDALPEWSMIDDYVASMLLRLECARTLERYRIHEEQPPEQIARCRVAVTSIIWVAKLIALDDEVLRRAEGVFSVALKALDAIHLASAMAWRDHNRQDLAFATHDDKLARAARAAGFTVLGA